MHDTSIVEQISGLLLWVHQLLGVFMLVTRCWAASEYLMHASKFNMMPNGERQIIGPD